MKKWLIYILEDGIKYWAGNGYSEDYNKAWLFNSRNEVRETIRDTPCKCLGKEYVGKVEIFTGYIATEKNEFIADLTPQ